MHTTLGPAWVATKGYGVPEVEQAYTRAHALCQAVGDAPQLFPVLSGLARFYVVRAELETARKLGEQLLHLAERAGESALRVGAGQTGSRRRGVGATSPGVGRTPRNGGEAEPPILACLAG